MIMTRPSKTLLAEPGVVVVQRRRSSVWANNGPGSSFCPRYILLLNDFRAFRERGQPHVGHPHQTEPESAPVEICGIKIFRNEQRESDRRRAQDKNQRRLQPFQSPRIKAQQKILQTNILVLW